MKRLLAMAAALCLAAGCGGTKSGMAPVSGQVKLDGQPLEGAQIMFTPSAPQSGSKDASTQSAGVTDKDGKFSLISFDAGEGALVGKHTVSISKSTGTTADGKAIDPNLASVAADMASSAVAAAGLVPAKYNQNTILTFDVPAGGTDKADFDLMSK
jgi:hypothetical protein